MEQNEKSKLDLIWSRYENIREFKRKQLFEINNIKKDIETLKNKMTSEMEKTCLFGPYYEISYQGCYKHVTVAIFFDNEYAIEMANKLKNLVCNYECGGGEHIPTILKMSEISFSDIDNVYSDPDNVDIDSLLDIMKEACYD